MLFRSPPREVVRRLLAEYDAADIIDVPSTFAARTFEENGVSRDRVTVSALGVDPLVFQPANARDQGRFRVLFVGRLELLKGLPYLLQAFSRLRLPDTELWLAGPSRAEIEPFLRKHQGEFKYLGPVNRDDLPDVYRAASVGVLPSVQEGFGLVLLEAMACGLPVIASTNTAGSDVIRDGTDGFVVPTRDASALEEKLLWLYRHRLEAEEMGREGRRRVLEQFTVAHYAERLVRNALGARRRKWTDQSVQPDSRNDTVRLNCSM